MKVGVIGLLSYEYLAYGKIRDNKQTPAVSYLMQ